MRDYLLLHLVILAWGFTAVLGKLIHLPAVEVVVWRTALAAGGFALWAGWARRPLQVPAGERWRMLGLGALLGLHWVLFFASARLATASVSLAALPTAMLWCSVLEPWLDGSRRWRPWELLAGAVVLAAVWMIYEVELRYWQGFSVGLGAAFLAAVYALVSKRWAGRWHPAVLGTHQMAGAHVVSAAAWAVTAQAPPVLPGVADAAWLLVLASVCTVGAYAGYMHVLRRLSVFMVNVVYNLEPVYGIVLAVLVFGRQEHMSPGFYAGAAIIVASVLLIPLLQRQRLRWRRRGPDADAAAG